MPATTSNAVQIVIGGRVSAALLSGIGALNKQLVGISAIAGRATGALAGIFAVSRITAFSAAAIEAADAVGKLAEKTGISIEAMGQLTFAAKQENIELETLQTALKGLSLWMLKTGQGAKSLEDALLDQAEIFSAMPDGAAKAAQAIKIFGRSGLDLIPFLNKGAAGIAELMDEARRLGSVTAEQARQADAWGDAWGRVNLAVQGLLLTLGGVFFDDLTDGVDDLAKSIGRLSESIRESESARKTLVAMTSTVGTFLAAWLAMGAVGLIIKRIQTAVAVAFGAGAIKSLRDFIALLRFLPTVLGRIIPVAGLVAAAVSVIWNREKIVDAALSFKFLGQTIEFYLVSALLKAEQQFIRLQIAWQRWMGASEESLEGLKFRLQEVTNTLSILRETFEKEQAQRKETPAPSPQGDIAELSTLEEQLKLDLAIQENIEKREKSADKQIASMKVQVDLIRQMKGLLGDPASLDLHSKEDLEIARQIIALEEKELAILNKIGDIEEQIAFARKARVESTFAGQAASGFNEFQQQKDAEGEFGLGGMGAGAIAGIQNAMVQLGTTAQQVGNAISTVIGGAVNGIAGAIEGLIRRTLTWKDALLQVGQAILDAIIGAIAQMLAQMLVSFVLQLVFGKLVAKQAALLATAWAPAAFLASVATYGTAVGVGVGALVAGMAVTQGLAQFAGGGFTGQGPRNEPAGIVHRGEYVVPAPAVASMGVSYFDSLVGGTPSETPSPRGRATSQNINLFLDKRAWMKANRDDMEAIALDVMRRNSWRA